VLNLGENTPQTFAPKTKAAHPSAPLARVSILPATKDIQHTKHFSNVA